MKTLKNTCLLVLFFLFCFDVYSQPVPVACYPFNGDAMDNSGNNHHGMVNGAILADDRFGNPGSAFEFDGVDDFIDIGTFGNIVSGNEVTISFWARTTMYALNSPILMVPNSNSDRLNVHIYYDNSGTPSTFWDFGNISGGGRLQISNVPFQTAWEHYAFVVSQSLDSMKVYKNGILQAGKSGMSSLVNRNKSVQIGGGNSSGTNCFFHGQLDDFEFYNVALNATEVFNLFVNGSSCSNASFNFIKGRAYYDLNSNSIYDQGEPILANTPITEASSGRICYTFSNGNYIMGVDTPGTYEISLNSSLQYFTSTPISHIVTFNSVGEIDSLNDFIIQPAGSFNDLRITISPLTAFRPGFTNRYNLHYENVGTTTIGGTVVFYPDNLINYSSANPNPDIITNDSIIWNINPIAPFESGNIEVSSILQIGTPNNTLINSTCKIEPIIGDENPIDNISAWEIYSTGSYDPNDITVDKTKIDVIDAPNPPWLKYMIRFQNTGNDTAFTVRINNIIPLELDLNTFQFLGSSHFCNISYNPDDRSFDFTHYNILLPDSFVNEPASHGYILYQMKPTSNLTVGSTITNNAGIYFDFNSPVLTNDAITEVIETTGIQNLEFGNIFVYPNPTSGKILIQSNHENLVLSIIDVNGRVIKKYVDVLHDKSEIDLSGLENGVYIISGCNSKQLFKQKLIKY